MDYPTIDIFHTANKGWGLRTMMDLQEGTFVGGEVITKDECEERVKAKAAEKNFNLYCATLMGDLVVDAEYYGGYVSSGQGRMGKSVCLCIVLTDGLCVCADPVCEPQLRAEL